jgi:hypothetical protein
MIFLINRGLEMKLISKLRRSFPPSKPPSLERAACQFPGETTAVSRKDQLGQHLAEAVLTLDATSRVQALPYEVPSAEQAASKLNRKMTRARHSGQGLALGYVGFGKAVVRLRRGAADSLPHPISE